MHGSRSFLFYDASGVHFDFFNDESLHPCGRHSTTGVPILYGTVGRTQKLGKSFAVEPCFLAGVFDGIVLTLDDFTIGVCISSDEVDKTFGRNLYGTKRRRRWYFGVVTFSVAKHQIQHVCGVLKRF